MNLQIKTSSIVEVLIKNPFDYILREGSLRIPVRYPELLVNFLTPYCGTEKNDAVTELSHEAAKRAGHGGGDYWIIRDWITAIETGAPPPIDVYTGLEWTAAGLCSQISIGSGGVPIRVPDFRDPKQRPVTLDAPSITP